MAETNVGGTPRTNGDGQRMKTDMERAAQETSSTAGDMAQKASDMGRQALTYVEDAADSTYRTLRSWWRDGDDVLRDTVARNPISTIAVSMLAGWIVLPMLFGRSRRSHSNDGWFSNLGDGWFSSRRNHWW